MRSEGLELATLRFTSSKGYLGGPVVWVSVQL